MKKKEIMKINDRLLYKGAWLATYSPGDGVTRYRLLNVRTWCKRYGRTPMDIEDGNVQPPDYFSGVAIMTVRGAKAARVMVEAYINGWEAGRNM